MRFTIAAVAAALDVERDPERRDLLERLALVRLQVSILRWQSARVASYLCWLRLDAAARGGDDVDRDGAAA